MDSYLFSFKDLLFSRYEVEDKRACSQPKKKRVKKKASEKYKNWKDIHGQQVTISHLTSTQSGTTKLSYRANFLYVSSDYPSVAVVDNLKRYPRRKYEAVKVLSREQAKYARGSSIIFVQNSGRDNRINVYLTRCQITELNGVSLRKVFGLDISKWPYWALKAHFLYQIERTFGQQFRVLPDNYDIDLRYAMKKDILVTLITKMRGAPIKKTNEEIEKLKKMGYYRSYSRRPYTIPIENEEQKTEQLLNEVFKI